VDASLIYQTFTEHIASKRDPRRGVEGSEGLSVRAKDMMFGSSSQIIYRRV
jgi:hypothetical protein